MWIIQSVFTEEVHFASISFPGKNPVLCLEINSIIQFSFESAPGCGELFCCPSLPGFGWFLAFFCSTWDYLFSEYVEKKELIQNITKEGEDLVLAHPNQQAL